MKFNRDLGVGCYWCRCGRPVGVNMWKEVPNGCIDITTCCSTCATSGEYKRRGWHRPDGVWRRSNFYQTKL